jgi:hypothetical protein
MANKKAYFQGGGGVNEPTPGKKKYKVDPSIVVQPRFKEPFYRNYDLYDTEGVSGPAQHGPGSGWSHMQEHKSVQEFLEFRRKRLKGKYVADDSYIQDTSSNYKERVDKMKVRATLLNRIVKQASGNHFKTLCSNCGATAAQCRCPGFFHKSEPQTISYVDNCSLCKTASDENDGPNFDYGDGAYAAMSEGKKIKSITDAPHKSPGAFFSDDNDIDFPIDDEVNHDSLIRPEEGQYQPPRLVGPSGTDDFTAQPSNTGFDSPQIEFTTPQIAGEHSYLPLPDFDGRSDDALNFGRNYDDESSPVGRTWDENSADSQGGKGGPILDESFNIDALLDHMEAKYLDESDAEDMPFTAAETEIYGLPDGVDPEAKDADKTIQNMNPWDTKSDIGTQMYEDKWNI